MTEKLSPREEKIKAALEKSLSSPDQTWFARFRWLNTLLPSDPRCTSCHSPFEGPGGTLVRALFDKRRSTMNPLLCNQCENMARRVKAGAEVEMAMLFADMRGSTPLAESMSATEFKQLIDRFYTESTHVLAHSLAMIDKLAGDEVSGFYLPAYIGKDFAGVAVQAARDVLEVTGHADPDGPWAPVGVGINTGVAYFGTVGTTDDRIEMTALGDEVNVAARLASHAAAGEVVLSESTVEKAGLDPSGMEKRTLELKGKREPVNVWVIRIASA